MGLAVVMEGEIVCIFRCIQIVSHAKVDAAAPGLWASLDAALSQQSCCNIALFAHLNFLPFPYCCAAALLKIIVFKAILCKAPTYV